MLEATGLIIPLSENTVSTSFTDRMFTRFGIWFDGCTNRCRQGFGFDTMALIVSCFTIISRGHLVFGLSMTIVEDGLIVDLLDLIWLRLWLWLIDWLWSDDDSTTWWLDLMITIWLQWFEDDDDIYDHDGYVTDILMNNTLTPRSNPLRLTSTGFTSRIDIISMAFTIGFVFYLSQRGCFHYKLDLEQFPTCGDRMNPDTTGYEMMMLKNILYSYVRRTSVNERLLVVRKI